MVTVNEPQVWTLIGVFAAAIFGMLGLVSTLFTRFMQAEFAGQRAHLVGEIGTLRAETRGDTRSLRAELGGEIGSLRMELKALDAKWDLRFDALDRDVQAIARHVFPDRE